MSLGLEDATDTSPLGVDGPADNRRGKAGPRPDEVLLHPVPAGSELGAWAESLPPAATTASGSGPDSKQAALPISRQGTVPSMTGEGLALLPHRWQSSLLLPSLLIGTSQRLFLGLSWFPPIISFR